MSYIISDDCINCGACEIECPQNAVHPGIRSRGVKNPVFTNNMLLFNGFIPSEHFYVDQYKCNNCEGFYLSVRCNEVCPVSCCLSENEYFSEGNVILETDPSLTVKISLN